MKRLLLALLLLAACQALPAPTPQASSISTLSQADSWQAPAALWPSTWREALLAWPASDAQGQARLWAAGTSRQARILALDACYPFDLSLWTASPEQAHLLWLDCAEDGLGLRLYHSTVSPDGQALLARRALSSAPTASYSALSLPRGGLLLAWIEGELGAGQAWTLRLDGQGRGLLRQQVARSAQQVALLADLEGLPQLLVQDDFDQVALLALLDEGALAWSQPQIIGQGRARRQGEALLHLQAAPSREGLLLAWQWQAGERAWVEWAIWPDAGRIPGTEVLRVLGQQDVLWARLLPSAQPPTLAAQWGDSLGLLRWTGQGFSGEALAQAERLASPPLALLRPGGGLLAWAALDDPLAQLRLLVWRG